MAGVPIRFVSSEVRDMYVSANITMHDGDVVILDSERHKKEIHHFLVLEKGSGNFERAAGGIPPTVTWEDSREEVVAVRLIEEFLRRYRKDGRFREQAQVKGIQVLDLVGLK